MDTETTEANTQHGQMEQRAIRTLAREWADYVGGYKQAVKVISEAYGLGWKHSIEANARHASTASLKPKSMAIAQTEATKVFIENEESQTQNTQRDR